MTAEEIRQEFEKAKAIITGSHFVYTSGKHGSNYVNKDALYPHVQLIDRLCHEMAAPFCILEHRVEAVIGPAIGGVILSQRVADHLSKLQGNEVLSLFAEKVGEDFVIKRGQEKRIAGKYTLVVEDVLTTGESAKSVIKAVRRALGSVVGLSVLCNRGGVTREELEFLRLKSLIDASMETYEETECPLCRDRVPINTDLGHGRAFLARTRK